MAKPKSRSREIYPASNWRNVEKNMNLGVGKKLEQIAVNNKS